MMATSGFNSRIHSCDFSKPENARFQYGSSVLPLSSAAPMAGTWDEPTPAMILATAYFRFAVLDFGLLFAFGLAADFFFPSAPAARNFDGVFLPERERLPSTERPPLSIMSA